jgi:hypothetical protein
MRKSRVLLAGVAVAAAGVATSAFTASNTLPDSVVGYGASHVSGAVVDTIHYDNSTTSSVVDAVVFETDSSVGGETASMQLQLKDTNGDEQNVGAPYTCAITGPVTGTYTITCDTKTRGTLNFEDFDLTGLTVAP